MFDTACTMIINKNSKMKMKKQGDDLEVWYTHYTAWHITHQAHKTHTI